LPLVFLVWANLHVQFVFGLLLLGLFLICLLAEYWMRTLRVSWLSDRVSPLPLAKVSAIAGVSFLFTFATPYSYHLFPVFMKALYSPIAFQYFAEMHTMSFRSPRDFAFMLLIMAAFFAFGRRRKLELFELMALIAGTVIAFRIQRDAWLAVWPAVAALSGGFGLRESGGERASLIPRRELLYAAMLTGIVIVVATVRLPDRERMMTKISQTFPAQACDFITSRRLPQPLFNTYSWGGFLTWYMPAYPVAVDGRVDLYGEEILSRYFQVTAGNERLEEDPSLASARTLLLERQSGMANAMVHLPALSAQYRMVYSDDLAAVFVRQ
jgi:hypothetical protein